MGQVGKQRLHMVRDMWEGIGCKENGRVQRGGEGLISSSKLRDFLPL